MTNGEMSDLSHGHNISVFIGLVLIFPGWSYQIDKKAGTVAVHCAVLPSLDR